MDFIVRQKGFWADDDDLVLKAIHEGFIQTHYAMWKELGQYLFFCFITYLVCYREGFRASITHLLKCKMIYH